MLMFTKRETNTHRKSLLKFIFYLPNSYYVFCYNSDNFKNMKCFVACAFNQVDVDIIYNLIKDVLKNLDITCLRVDKINHNQKIDQKIIALIESCDFGIADLSYARP